MEYAGIPLGIAGVQSTCVPEGYVSGMPTNVWTWVTDVSSCYSAATAPVQWEIQQQIQEVPPSWIEIAASDRVTFAEIRHAGGAELSHPDAIPLGDGADDVIAVSTGG